MMEAFRKIVKVEENRLDLELPKHFTNGDYEVIVLPVKERTQNKKKPSDYMGIISKKEAQVMLANIKESREEWERDI